MKRSRNAYEENESQSIEKHKAFVSFLKVAHRSAASAPGQNHFQLLINRGPKHYPDADADADADAPGRGRGRGRPDADADADADVFRTRTRTRSGQDAKYFAFKKPNAKRLIRKSSPWKSSLHTDFFKFIGRCQLLLP